MSVYGVKLPDVGEGVAEAELIEWYVAVGDRVTPDTVLADVMTDKATVEISSPVTGVVTFRVGEPGEVLAVGTEFVGIEIEGSDPAPTGARGSPGRRRRSAGRVASARHGTRRVAATRHRRPSTRRNADAEHRPTPHRRAATRCRGRRASGDRPAAPAVRARAAALGIDLSSLTGSGPDGRVVHADLDRRLAGSTARRVRRRSVRRTQRRAGGTRDR